MQNSNLDNIRWIVDDALKFVKKKLEEGIFIKVLFLTLHHLGMGQTEKNGN